MADYHFSAYEENGSNVTKDFKAGDLSSILKEFQYFLKGAGFEFNGNIELVPTEEDNRDPFADYNYAVGDGFDFVYEPEGDISINIDKQ
jgi:hypothetical protein